MKSASAYASGPEDINQITGVLAFLVYGYLFIFYTRIQDNIPGLGSFPWVGAWFLLVIFIGFLKFRKEHLSTPIIVIFWLGAWYGITGIGAISTISLKLSILWMIERFFPCVALYVLFSHQAKWHSFLKFWVVIYFVMGLFTLKNAPYGPGDFTRDENDLALAFAMGFPYAFYSSLLPNESKLWRYFCYATCTLLLAGIVISSSRGGLLGLIVVFGAMWWLSVKRGRIALYLVGAGVVAGSLLLSLLPASYIADMQTIQDSEDATRVERIHTWEIGWEMFKDKPILGVGAGNFPNTSHLYEHKTSWYTGNERSLSGREAHSLYFQIIPELGLFGIAVFVYFLFLLPLKLIPKARNYQYEDENDRLKKIYLNILLASMAGYVSAGAFISVAYYPHLAMWLTVYAVYLKVSQVEKKPTDSSAQTPVTNK